MIKIPQRRSDMVGLPPGSLVHVGERKAEEVAISVLEYDEAHVRQAKGVEDALLLKDRPTVLWVNVDGLHQVDVLERLGAQFGLHPLILEDILHTQERPKVEDLGDYLFITLKAFSHAGGLEQDVEAEQVSLVLGSNYVLSFQEQDRGLFDPVRKRIETDKGRARKMGPDYLAYALIDVIVDRYFAVLEQIGEQIEDLQEDLVTHPETGTLRAIHRLKTGLASLRKSVWPLREVIGSLERFDSALILESTRMYLRDVYDHTIQVIDTVETYRDMLAGMLDIYLSSVSNRMNAIMKVLTIIATVFIPLTFVAGVYGMNFQYMPELTWRWGYPAVWLVMIVVAGLMLRYFWRKGWF